MKDEIRHAFHWSGYISIVLAFIILVGAAYYMYYPFKTLDVISGNKILTLEVEAGEYVKWEFVYCKYAEKAATINKHLVNDIIISIPPIKTNIDTGCGNVTASLRVPKFAQPGEYHVKTVFEYEMNPLRTIIVQYETDKFNVISKGEH